MSASPDASIAGGESYLASASVRPEPGSVGLPVTGAMEAVAQRIERSEPDEGRKDAGSTPASIPPASMTERLIDAAIYNEQAEGVYRTGAMKELNDARAAIEAALASAETQEKVDVAGLVARLRKAAEHAGVLLVDPPKPSPMMALLNEAADALTPAPTEAGDER